MSEVKRYVRGQKIMTIVGRFRLEVPGDRQFVRASDYDALAARCDSAAGGWREANRVIAMQRERLDKLEQALKFYADGDHLLLADADAWDTCSGEPVNFLHDEAGTASVEDGSIAKAALAVASASRPELCKSCQGQGVTHTGIEESPTTLCGRCDGGGVET